MQILHLQIEDDYIEEFLKTLPHDKVRFIEKDFEENKQKLNQELDNYSNKKKEFISYSDSMKNLDDYLKGME